MHLRLLSLCQYQAQLYQSSQKESSCLSSNFEIQWSCFNSQNCSLVRKDHRYQKWARRGWKLSIEFREIPSCSWRKWLQGSSFLCQLSQQQDPKLWKAQRIQSRMSCQNWWYYWSFDSLQIDKSRAWSTQSWFLVSQRNNWTLWRWVRKSKEVFHWRNEIGSWSSKMQKSSLYSKEMRTTQRRRKLVHQESAIRRSWEQVHRSDQSWSLKQKAQCNYLLEQSFDFYQEKRNLQSPRWLEQVPWAKSWLF